MSVDAAKDFDSDDERCIVVFQRFLEERHQKELVEILLHNDASACYSLVVNSLELFDSDLIVSQLLVTNPRKVLPVFHCALRNALRSLVHNHSQSQSMRLKKNAFIRLSNLPTCPELTRHTVPRSSDIGRFVAVTGN